MSGYPVHVVRIVEGIATCPCGWYVEDDSSDSVGLEAWKTEHEQSQPETLTVEEMAMRHHSRIMGKNLPLTEKRNWTRALRGIA